MTECRVTYRTAFDRELRAFVVKQLVKYLLLIRGQVPCLYDELPKFVERFRLEEQMGPLNGKRLPLRGGLKKAVKCVEAAEQLFQVHLDAIFALQVKRVALVFGSSTISPREVFIVEFEDVEDAEVLLSGAVPSPVRSGLTDDSLEDSETMAVPSRVMTREKLMHLCAQKCMRALFVHSMQHFSRALPATKLHVAVLADRQAARVAGFIPKQHFKLRLPKDKRGVRTHYVTICSKLACKKDSQQLDAVESTYSNTSKPSGRAGEVEPMSIHKPANTNESDMLWHVLELPIPGFSEVINTREGQ
uniref:HORMA domain-containing protein n=1 Tax=Peronospora matthiolae TaxID=2874970 RepID=A0AAV1V064_9STRA